MRCIKISNIVKITGNKNRYVNTCKCRRATATATAHAEARAQARHEGGAGARVGQLSRRLKLAVKLWQKALRKMRKIVTDTEAVGRNVNANNC